MTSLPRRGSEPYFKRIQHLFEPLIPKDDHIYPFIVSTPDPGDFFCGPHKVVAQLPDRCFEDWDVRRWTGETELKDG